MGSGKRYTEEFKIEAVKQVTERGHGIYSVAARLGITHTSLYKWINVTATTRSEGITGQRNQPSQASHGEISKRHTSRESL
jgi:transposase-like protein